MMDRVESSRKRWIDTRPAYDEFGKRVADILRKRLRDEGMWGDIGSRAKEVDSFVKKLILKPDKEYETIGDKCGVRVVLRYKNQVDEVLGFLGELFQCGEVEKKVDTMNTNQFGYLSAHVDIKALAGHDLAKDYPPDQFSAELQVRTLAQHLWSEMAHDPIYKNNDGLAETSEGNLRRTYRLAAVVELADDEFSRINAEMNVLPEVELYRALERNYYKLTGRQGDVELSMSVIRNLMPLIEGEDIHEVIRSFDTLFAEKHEMLSAVFDDIDEDDNWSAYMFQPESLLVYAMIQRDRYALQECWSKQYSDIDLERLANKFGESLS